MKALSAPVSGTFSPVTWDFGLSLVNSIARNRNEIGGK
jgi:hypothetical protein